MSLASQDFQKLVLNWFKKHGRQGLPWQQNKTPYRVWLSEIMLQQTQVNTVIPYFQRFLERFPDLSSLAQAEEDEVLHLWSGLGYYSRARNLLRSAKLIQEHHQGALPADLTLLQKLPGIGRSTAGAILTCAFNQKAAILDGNVKRLLARFHAVKGAIDQPKTLEKLWQLAEAYTPVRRVADYTQVMMDLGATLCTRSKPRCGDCPLVKHCKAHQQGLVEQLPQKKSRRELPLRKTRFLVFLCGKEVLLEKRPSKGLWGGLWSLPEVSAEWSQAQIKRYCQEQWQLTTAKLKPLASIRHSFTHFHLEILPLCLPLKPKAAQSMAGSKQIWYSLTQPTKTLGLPTPVQTLLNTLKRTS